MPGWESHAPWELQSPAAPASSGGLAISSSISMAEPLSSVSARPHTLSRAPLARAQARAAPRRLRLPPSAASGAGAATGAAAGRSVALLPSVTTAPGATGPATCGLARGTAATCTPEMGPAEAMPLGTKTEAATLNFEGVPGGEGLMLMLGVGLVVGIHSVASARSFEGEPRGASSFAGEARGDDPEAALAMRQTCRRSMRLDPHSRSMAWESSPTSLTRTMRSPGTSTFSAAPLLPHCRFQASEAPPGSTLSMCSVPPPLALSSERI
mmetsp:Transcript_37705/g.111947  ORF Transcript_37705/g.111947 Transcript_37705/m.111947 type:complete len:268 (+) Transcript_37705:79-882(+)